MDKPSKEEWSVCAGMALQLAAEDAPPSLRRRYFAYMRKLRQKYPESVDVLASIADVYAYHEPAVKLLLETYRLAERNRDYRKLARCNSTPGQ